MLGGICNVIGDRHWDFEKFIHTRIHYLFIASDITINKESAGARARANRGLVVQWPGRR